MDAAAHAADHAAPRPHFETLEHTADVGVRGIGRTLAEAFGEVARGMYAQMVDLDTVREAGQREVVVHGPTRERLLVAFLLELLYLTESEAWFFARFQVEIDERSDGLSLHATAFGEPIDPARHRLGVQVKAVTRHRLQVIRTPSAFEARVILDI